MGRKFKLVFMMIIVHFFQDLKAWVLLKIKVNPYVVNGPKAVMVMPVIEIIQFQQLDFVMKII